MKFQKTENHEKRVLEYKKGQINRAMNLYYVFENFPYNNLTIKKVSFLPIYHIKLNDKLNTIISYNSLMNCILVESSSFFKHVEYPYLFYKNDNFDDYKDFDKYEKIKETKSLADEFLVYIIKYVYSKDSFFKNIIDEYQKTLFLYYYLRMNDVDGITIKRFISSMYDHYLKGYMYNRYRGYLLSWLDSDGSPCKVVGFYTKHRGLNFYTEKDKRLEIGINVNCINKLFDLNLTNVVTLIEDKLNNFDYTVDKKGVNLNYLLKDNIIGGFK